MVFDARLVQTVDAILRLQGFLAKKINSSLSYDCQFFFCLTLSSYRVAEKFLS